MSSVKDHKKYHLLNADEPPAKKLLSDGDLLIKELALKQSNKNVTLQSELNKHQNFHQASEFLPITSVAKGCNSLSEFQNVTSELDQLEDLKSAGLTLDEIALLKDYKEGVTSKRKNLSKEHVNVRLTDIRLKINEHQTQCNTFEKANLDKNSRHLREFALQIKPESTETKLLKFALNNKSHTQKLPRPIDSIKDIERDLFSNLSSDPVNVAKIRRKARKLAARVNKVETIEPQFDSNQVDNERNSKWDVKTVQLDQVVHRTEKVYTCKPQNYYTIKDGQIVKLNKQENGNGPLLDVENRLDEDGIKNIQKFKNYQRGTPSKILYLNNLPNSIKEEELKEVFKSYDAGQLFYKVLDNRLRGRAFVYFPDENSATSALNGLLGVLVRNKPLVIEYGKSKKENASSSST